MQRHTWSDTVRPLILNFATEHGLRFVSRTLDAALEDIGGSAGHSFIVETDDEQQVAAITYFDLDPHQAVFYVGPDASPSLRVALHHLSVHISTETGGPVISQSQLLPA